MTTVRVELYVRSLLAEQAQNQQERVIERLQTLADEGPVDEFQIIVWGRQAPASPAQARTDAGLFALNRVAVFTKWAERNGLSVDEHFEQRTVESSMTEESYRAVRFPVMTLAEYHDTDLAFVAPATGDEGSFAVHDRLDAIEARGGTARTTDAFDRLDRAYSEPPEELTLAHEDNPDLTEL